MVPMEAETIKLHGILRILGMTDSAQPLVPRSHGQKKDQIRILFTVKFKNFRTPGNFAVIYLKLKQRGQT